MIKEYRINNNDEYEEGYFLTVEQIINICIDYSCFDNQDVGFDNHQEEIEFIERTLNDL